MSIILAILIPVIVACFMWFWTYQELKTLLMETPIEYKLISIPVSFMIGLCFGIGSIAFL